MILTALTKLRRAVVSHALVGGPQRLSKLEAVIEKLDEGVSEGDKIPVFSQYVRVLRMLERRIHRHE
jgi:SNF2 family DNA or RNA helicase